VNEEWAELISRHVSLVEKYHRSSKVSERVEAKNEFEKTFSALFAFPSSQLSDADLQVLKQAEGYLAKLGGRSK
jgi:hypothetical protein